MMAQRQENTARRQSPKMPAASQKPIATLAIVFPYKAGDEASPLVTMAEVIRDELAKQILQVTKLMEPVPATR
jgi:hypothetical protein